MIKAIIIDDEPLARSIIKEYLQNYLQIQVVQECGDGFEGLKAIQQQQPDVIFLDIQMPKINGFEMLELAEPLPAVVFTTAFDEYAIKAFEAHAIDYLLKPFSKERFDKAVQKCLQQRNTEDTPTKTQALLETANAHTSENQRVVVKKGNNIRIIPTHEIHYIAAYDDYVKIYTQEDYFLKKKTMQFFETSLDTSEFVRVHRSYIVQVAMITRLEPMEKDNYVVLLKSGIRIPLSKSGYGKLKALLDL